MERRVRNGTRDGMRWTWIALGLGVLLGGCGDDSTGSGDLCEGVDCSGHGRCAVVGSGESAQAVCLCDTGWRADGLSCVEIVAGAECEGVDCSGHGRCVVGQGEPNFPVCLCDEGYVLAGTTTCLEATGGVSCGPGTHLEGDHCLPNDTSRPEGFCEPRILETNGRIALESPSLDLGVSSGAMAWTGAHYLVVYYQGRVGLLARTVTPDGQVGSRVTILGTDEISQTQYGGLVGLARCGDRYCGYFGDRSEDTLVVGFVLDEAGSVQATADLGTGMPVGIAGGGDQAYVVMPAGFVALAPDGTAGSLTPFGDGSRTVVAVARSSEIAPMVTVSVVVDNGWQDPKLQGWDETGNAVLGPVDVFSGLTDPMTSPVFLDGTPAGLLLVGATTRAQYAEAFDMQGRSQGLRYLNDHFFIHGLGVSESFVVISQEGPAFSIVDILGRPLTDAGGAPVVMVPEDVQPMYPAITSKQGLAAESKDRVGVLLPWFGQDPKWHLDLVRIGCE